MLKEISREWSRKHNREAEMKDLNWYRKRKITSCICIAYKCIIYFEYWAIAISGIYYYKTSFDIADPKFYYGCLAAMYIGSVFSNFLCGRIMDKTRDLRAIVLTMSVFNIVGNITYTLTWSPWLPSIGRLLCGSSIGMITAIAGSTFTFSHFNNFWDGSPHSRRMNNMPLVVLVN